MATDLENLSAKRHHITVNNDDRILGRCLGYQFKSGYGEARVELISEDSELC